MEDEHATGTKRLSNLLWRHDFHSFWCPIIRWKASIYWRWIRLDLSAHQAYATDDRSYPRPGQGRDTRIRVQRTVARYASYRRHRHYRRGPFPGRMDWTIWTRTRGSSCGAYRHGLPPRQPRFCTLDFHPTPNIPGVGFNFLVDQSLHKRYHTNTSEIVVATNHQPVMVPYGLIWIAKCPTLHRAGKPGGTAIYKDRPSKSLTQLCFCSDVFSFLLLPTLMLNSTFRIKCSTRHGEEDLWAVCYTVNKS